MSFSRVNASGWSVGAKLTSAQMNQLDTDHANALDKSIAGDTLSGPVTTSGAGQIRAATANSLLAQIASGISTSVASGIQSPVANGINASIAGGIQPGVAAGIQSNIAGGIQSNIAGGIQLAGGANDWPTFSANRSRTLIVPAQDVWGVSNAAVPQGSVPAAWATTPANMPILLGANTGFQTSVVNSASGNAWAYVIPIRNLHNGATITGATLYFKATTHANLPPTMPAFAIYTGNMTLGTGILSLASSNFAVDPSANIGAYDATHSWSLTVNQNNVINTATNYYWLIVWDEGGASNTAVGNIIFGATLTYGSIPNMAFP